MEIIIIGVVCLIGWYFLPSKQSPTASNVEKGDFDDKVYEYYQDTIFAQRCAIFDEVKHLEQNKDFKALEKVYLKFLDAVTEEDNYCNQHPFLFLYGATKPNASGQFNAFIEYADILIAVGKYEEAIDWVHACRTMKPHNLSHPIAQSDSKDWLGLMGRSHQYLGKIYGANAQYKLAIEHNLIKVSINRLYEPTKTRLANQVFGVGSPYLKHLGYDAKSIKAIKDDLFKWFNGLEHSTYDESLVSSDEFYRTHIC